ncbi:MAG: polysaccharide biosynthesis protein, partial [Treponema sp.]|nr:polysaccharide biosynthesis protein [Treponema sp.]
DKLLYSNTISFIIPEDINGKNILETLNDAKQYVYITCTSKDIDIKFIGKRKGERETEPLWLKEEEPKKTEFSKILKLKNLDFESSKIQELLSKLKPICFLSTENEKTQELYRNNQYLIDLLCDEIPSLQEFYKEQ